MKNPCRLAAAVAAAFGLAAAVAVPASAVEQSSYSQTTNSTSCSAGYVSGYVNYCRNTDPKRINYTGGRDLDRDLLLRRLDPRDTRKLDVPVFVNQPQEHGRLDRHSLCLAAPGPAGVSQLLPPSY